MRADLTLMALARESNRYLLTRLIAKATRKLHRPKTRLQDTMNDACERFGMSHGSVRVRIKRERQSATEAFYFLLERKLPPTGDHP